MPDLFSTLLPLAALILLGWAVGRARSVDLNSIATLLVYAVTPVVAFGSTAQIAFNKAYILLPVFAALMATLNGMSAHAVARKILRDRDAGYLMPIVAGAGNNGYFGVPLAAAILAPEWLGVYFLVMMGVTIFESTLGYYFIARGHLPFRQALMRVIRLPTVYAIMSGVIFSGLSLQLPQAAIELTNMARGCYITLGMMLIGLALAQHGRLVWEKDFIALSVLGKYAGWAILTALFITADIHILHLYSPDIYKMFAILAVTPVAVNSVAYAAENNFRPELAATVVFVTTVFSCLALPLALSAILGLF